MTLWLHRFMAGTLAVGLSIGLVTLFGCGAQDTGNGTDDANGDGDDQTTQVIDTDTTTVVSDTDEASTD